MTNDIYDPLDEYVNTFRPKFERVARETFAELAKEAQVDVEANHETCSRLYDTEDEMEDVNNKYWWARFFCFLLWGGVIAGAIYLYKNQNSLDTTTVYLIFMVMVVAVLCLLFKIHPLMSSLSDENDDLKQQAHDIEMEGWQQMEPLNRLYDWDMLPRMITATVPKIEFDPYFTTQRLADLRRIYGWNDLFNEGRSVIYCHSGLINGNPFVLCRTRKMEMGTKTYYGHKTIYWTTREYGSDGKMKTEHHSQTLTASVTAPYPGYYEKTRLIYGNVAAPNLTFYRKKNGLASCKGSLSYRWHRRKLHNKARNLSKGDYAMMTNEDFEVAFDTSNRNDNQQFALLFTPLAQANMLKLLQDDDVGYGDDFDFVKDHMINTIIPDHIQAIDLDMNPRQYQHFDYDQAEHDFHDINARLFRAIYFSLAPLLCVPMYQQIRSRQDIYGSHMQRQSAFWEHEALANFLGQAYFKHPQCVTDNILKTKAHKDSDGSTTITVFAHGYRTEKRLTYISKWGGDGRTHQVPVYWDEYLPVVGQGSISMTEDNSADAATSQKQRIDHISDVLKKSGLNVYRRHIASKVR